MPRSALASPSLFASLTLGLCLAFVLVAACSGKIAGGEANGPAIYRQVCAPCHGLNGEPDATMVARNGVKTLRSARVQAIADDEMRRQILEGSDNKKMPAFQGGLTAAQLDAVIAHVRALAD